MPSLDGLYFILDFTAEGKTAVNTDLKSGLTLTVALEPEDWTLEVKGYSGHTENSIGSLVVRGTSSVSITAGISSPVAVYLTPDFSSGGTGTLSYNVSFPKTRAFLSVYPLSAQGTGQEIDISESAVGSITDLSAGTYQAFIDLYDRTNNQAAVWTGVVHVYDGSTTSLAKMFTLANFVACPPLVGEGETTLAAKLEAALLASPGSYTIVLDGEEELIEFVPKTLSGVDDQVIALTIRGNGKTVQVNETGTPLFTLAAGFTLAIQDITLKGMDGNSAPVVKVNNGGNLELKVGSSLTGNTSNTSGGGVVVDNGGALSMNGGEISSNTASGSNGGGVYINGGTFTLSGGAISGNSTPNSGGNGNKGGGGVYVTGGGTFTMTGGEVSGNRSGHDGGGVFAYGATFEMSGGEVSGNTANFGGGVYVAGGGTFTMNNGAISGNTVADNSGGVMVNGGTFTMNDGAISGNTASGNGGGVYVSGSGTFTMSGGVIYGSEAVNGSKANTAPSGGAAIYKNGGTFPDTTNDTIDKRQLTP
jgi:parallel beta-helix repeat protein